MPERDLAASRVVGALRDDASDSTSTRPEARERPTGGACRIGATTQASRQESGLAPQHRNGATSTSPPSSAHPERQALRKQLFDGESPSLEISKRGASSSTTTSATSTRATAKGPASSAASERFAVGAGAVESSEASVVPAVQRTAAWLERYGCAAATPSGASIKPAVSAAAASASPPAASTSHLDAGARSASAAKSAARSAARSSARELRELGFSAAQLKDQGFSAKELLEGFSSSELIELNPRTRLGARVLGSNGFRPSELMHAGVTVEELRAGGWPLASLKDDLELSLGRSAVKELKAGGFVAKELRKAGYSVDELTKAGFKKRIAEAVDGRTLKELLAEGALTARKGGGREGHYEAHELREAGFSAKELKGAQLDARSLKVAGYTAKEMRLAEFKLKELIGAGYSAAELKDGGFEMGLPRMGPLEFKFDKSAEISESWLEGLVDK
ncbi:hypothetical protein Ctob_007572 [Chrysochromulina tobinii]|uniref:Uncharacterized protein n=1 Tax=Chrysochromulina tobinii TaxID=1460289 RepID=A0A0M0JWP5_9EUKA|nr:hypothetical protein Ctob_007572 [Chrysochromulina tobinii]|eukprot:KOO31081.1 hypothetical protein Ctob_007572 [Chrysochromulina sp. CCMP291]